jgi:hypothetical protein
VERDSGAARGWTTRRVRRRINDARTVRAEIRLEDLDGRGGRGGSFPRDRCRYRTLEREVEQCWLRCGGESSEYRVDPGFDWGAIRDHAS